jgi:hypothetical protein
VDVGRGDTVAACFLDDCRNRLGWDGAYIGGHEDVGVEMGGKFLEGVGVGIEPMINVFFLFIVWMMRQIRFCPLMEVG